MISHRIIPDEPLYYSQLLSHLGHLTHHCYLIPLRLRYKKLSTRRFPLLILPVPQGIRLQGTLCRQ